MNHLSEITGLLNTKHRLMLDFERVTEEMLSCSFDEIEPLLTERGRIILEADGLDDKIELTTDKSGSAAHIKAALSGSAERGELDIMFGELYDAAGAVRSVVLRALETELQLEGRLKGEQERLLKTIRDTNRGLSARAARFSPAPSESSGQIAKA